MKKFALTLVCLALLAISSTAARADEISFSFVFDPSGTGFTTGQSSNLSAGPGLVVVISDQAKHLVYTISGDATVLTGATTHWTTPGGTLDASYGAGGSVLVTDTVPVTLVSGTMEDGSLYTASLGGGAGSFHGLFNVTYVNPATLALFGLDPSYEPEGSVSLNTGNNVLSEDIVNANLTGGTITIQTPVPEPGTMALLGTGILGLAGAIRRWIIL